MIDLRYSEVATQLAACPFCTVSKRGIMLRAPTGHAFVQTSQPSSSQRATKSHKEPQRAKRKGSYQTFPARACAVIWRRLDTKMKTSKCVATSVTNSTKPTKISIISVGFSCCGFLALEGCLLSKAWLSASQIATPN